MDPQYQEIDDLIKEWLQLDFISDQLRRISLRQELTFLQKKQKNILNGKKGAVRKQIKKNIQKLEIGENLKAELLEMINILRWSISGWNCFLKIRQRNIDDYTIQYFSNLICADQLDRGVFKKKFLQNIQGSTLQYVYWYIHGVSWSAIDHNNIETIGFVYMYSVEVRKRIYDEMKSILKG